MHELYLLVDSQAEALAQSEGIEVLQEHHSDAAEAHQDPNIAEDCPLHIPKPIKSPTKPNRITLRIPPLSRVISPEEKRGSSLSSSYL